MLLTEDHDTWAVNRTQEVWRVSSLLTIERCFQKVSWFSVNPWELNNSLSFLFQRRGHTWEPVYTGFRQAPVWVFQNLMQRSLSPPPDASKLLWNGHQARALTDDVWCSNWCSHWFWFRVLEEAAERSYRYIVSCHCLHWRVVQSLTILDRRPPLHVLGICWQFFHPFCQLLEYSFFQERDPTRDSWTPLKVLNCTMKIGRKLFLLVSERQVESLRD